MQPPLVDFCARGAYTQSQTVHARSSFHIRLFATRSLHSGRFAARFSHDGRSFHGHSFSQQYIGSSHNLCDDDGDDDEDGDEDSDKDEDYEDDETEAP